MDAEEALLRLAGEIEAKGSVDLSAFLRSCNRGLPSDGRPLSKKRLSALFFRTQADRPERFEEWGFSDQTVRSLRRALQMKPRRTASGVATITVLTKPWPCGNDCAFCPNDIRMPKSYLSNEPACQRAERNWFDPYLQVASRIRALEQMGHVTDKVELIVLGGSWCDYPQAYRRWFVHELFRALNDCGTGFAQAESGRIRQSYRALGLPVEPDDLEDAASAAQAALDAHDQAYAQAFSARYSHDCAWQELARRQTATWEEVEFQQRRNESAAKRNVGLVFETRPETIEPWSLASMRRLGATKIQVGVQSLEQGLLDSSGRGSTVESARTAFELLRLFGFKIHAHFMVNLPGATPESDKRDFARFVSDPAFIPDELKLYPTVLTRATRLELMHQTGEWRPYGREQLLDVLEHDVRAVGPHIRISRMIRDISQQDIVAGNTRANLREDVESRIEASGARVAEIRHREIAGRRIDPSTLSLSVHSYRTTVGVEEFLQWVTPDGLIAGFLRLSLPDPAALSALGREDLPAGQAMVRELHVYGASLALGEDAANATGAVGEDASCRSAQHVGLGRALIEEAVQRAQRHGYRWLAVISAVGTREYYRNLGFEDNGAYLRRPLEQAKEGMRS